MQILKVCPSQSAISHLFYSHEGTPVLIGSLVLFKIRHKTTLGVVIDIFQQQEWHNLEISKKIPISKLKPIENLLKKDFLNPEFIQFLTQASNYTCNEINRFLDLILPSFVVNKVKNKSNPDSQTQELNSESESFEVIWKNNSHNKKISSKNSIYIKNLNAVCKNDIESKIFLNEEQNEVFNGILKNKAGDFSVSLINGVTGSGKSYVIFKLIDEILKRNKEGQVLLMLPEIGLAKVLFEKMSEVLNHQMAIWHSSISPAKKFEIYGKIASGDLKIVIGTRSSLFLPYKNLKIVIIDEEHDYSYKQNEIPTYQGKDMAILLAKSLGIPVVLSSATPSLETINNVLKGRYQIFNLHNKFFNTQKPVIKIVDLAKDEIIKSSKGQRLLSGEAINLISHSKKMGEQILLFLNKRGYSKSIICNECLFQPKCENCDNFLTLHKKKNKLLCHYCGFFVENFEKCKECDSKMTSFGGFGIEKLFDEVNEIFDKKVSIGLLSSDEKNEEIILKAQNKEVDVLVGTQIITKGFHFSNLNSVVVLNADFFGSDSDFRSYERIYQVITQVLGRVGRELNNSQAIIQTYNPNNKIFGIISSQEPQNFYEYEINQRKIYKIPPYGTYISLFLSGKNEKILENFSKSFAISLSKWQISNFQSQKVKILGPERADVFYMQNQYRYKFLIKIESNVLDFNIKLRNFVSLIKTPSSVLVKIDVNPYSSI